MKKLRQSIAGFTMMDLIVVTAIIALLAAILIPGYFHYIGDAKKSAVIADARTVYLAAQAKATESKGMASAERPYHIPDANDLRVLLGSDDIYDGVTKLTIVDDNMDGTIDKIEMIKNQIDIVIEPGKKVIIDGEEKTTYNP
ncbi:MAG: hypothetical protein RR614_04315 [Eubacterium sp.]